MVDSLEPGADRRAALLAVIGPALRAQPWRASAACRGMPLALFFPDEGHPVSDLARGVCAACSVADECREWSIGEPAQSGFAGGLTGRERARLRAQRRRSAA